MTGGCAGCGGEYVTIEDYCGECWQTGTTVLRWCPACGHDVSGLVDETVALRVRRASHDVAATGIGRRTADALRALEKVMQARREAS